MPVVVPTVNTGETHAVWVDRVFRDITFALERRGVPLDVAWPMALALSVHLWRETGEGDSEWNFDPGNIACTGTPDAPGARGWHGECAHVGRGLERAYASSVDGIEDYVQLLEGPRYRASWRHLLDDPDDASGWYAQLLHDGYSAYSVEAVDEFSRIAASWRRVRAS